MGTGIPRLSSACGGKDAHLLMVHQGALLSDVLLGQVDGWKGRHGLQRSVGSPPLQPHTRGHQPEASPGLAHPSSLTIVQLGGWPQGARPEIGRLARSRNKDSGTFWAFPTLRVCPLGNRLGRLGSSTDHPQAQLTTCHSLTPGFLPKTLMQLQCWGLGLRASPAGVPGVARRGAPS